MTGIGFRRAGVIGHPISHSKSPLIHNYWLKKYAIDGEYKAYDITSENLRDEIIRLRDAGFRGLNVTLPHKRAVMDICTTLTDEAAKIGAVNTIIFYPNGEIEGRNTDAYGFIANAKEACADIDFKNKKAFIVGAGGAARAVLYALKREGVSNIKISNRTITRAEELGDEFGATVYDWEEKENALKNCDIVVNTTSLGMKGQKPLEINLENLSAGAIVYDIVYTPLMTDLLLQAENKGCRVVTGIGMLLHQARPAYQAFYGASVEVDDELRQALLR